MEDGLSSAGAQALYDSVAGIFVINENTDRMRMNLTNRDLIVYRQPTELICKFCEHAVTRKS